MAGFDNTVVQPWMRPFPHAESVFRGDVAAHRRVLLPLMSLETGDLGAGYPKWLHFVCPIEPYDGVVGWETNAYHSTYCKENWIAFRVEASKYQFDADFRYFKINGPFEGEHAEANLEFLEKDYREKEEYFERVRSSFEMDGKLRSLYYERPVLEWFETLEGAAFYGNWAVGSALPIKRTRDEDGEMTATPLTQAGQPFQYIGSISRSLKKLLL